MRFIVFLEPKYVIMANDSRPHSLNVESWRLDMGALLSKFIDGLTEKVVVIISGDLSHHHPTDCDNPLYMPDSR